MTEQTSTNHAKLDMPRERETLIETKLVKGQDLVREITVAFFERAGLHFKADKSYVYSLRDETGPERTPLYLPVIRSIRRQNPDFVVRYITNIGRDNVEYVKRMLDENIEVRHLEGNRLNFSVNFDEYTATTQGDRTRIEESIYSNDSEVVSQFTQVFSKLWDSAIPASARIRELEQGLTLGETRILYDTDRAPDDFEKLFSECKQEFLAIVASEDVVLRSKKLYDVMRRRVSRDGVRLRLLAPVAGRSAQQILSGLEWRRIREMNIGIAIFDRDKMLISQYAKSSKVRDSKESATSSIHTLMSNILTTNKPTISGMADLFEELWNESLLREQERNARQMEEKARLEQERVSKEARLLQDILTHDIRNYNQVIKFSAELLREELSDNKNVDMLTDSLLKAVDGSIQLLDNAKKLGTLLSDQNPELFPVNLMETLESSLSLVKSANPDRVIEETRQISLAGYEIIPHNEVQVLADDFLLDVFTNILTNAIKYTIGRVVRIETVIEEAREDRVNAPDEEEPNSFLKISIGDYGVGIPNDRKEKIFGRYLEGAKGIGLGMSIVHALIVDRYHGKIRIGDRVEGDYTKGTVVKIWIPKVVNSAAA